MKLRWHQTLDLHKGGSAPPSLIRRLCPFLS